MRRVHLISRIVFLLIIIFNFLPEGARAEDGAIKFSWGITASLLEGTVGLFSPPQIPEVYVLSDRTHIFSGKMTYVYYWPLEREYKPDWSQLNQDVEGFLDIYDSQGNKVQTLEKEWYLFQQIIMGEDVSYQMVRGEQAHVIYKEYETRRDHFFRAMEQYDQELGQYLDQLEKADNPSIQAPEKPAQFIEVMQEPQLAFILNLPPGRFSIELRDTTNNPVPDSQRTLVSVAPRRESVGLIVFPETRWTEPEVSYEARDVIYYTTSDPVLYFQPVNIYEFNQREFARLNKPQETISSPNSWIWIKGEMITDFGLEVLINKQFYEKAAYETFSVIQNPGFALGYEIFPSGSEGGLRPDFAAYKVLLNPEIPKYTIRLINSQGDVFQNSQREIVRASSNLQSWVVLFLLLPVIIGSGLRVNQFIRKKQNVKKLSQHDGV